MRILTSQLSPFGARLRIACALKGLSAEFELPPGAGGSAALRQVTPFGRMPAVVLEDGRVLVESLALLEYIEDSQPNTRSLRPANPVDRARVRMIALLFDHNVVKALVPLWAEAKSPTPNLPNVCSTFDGVAAELDKLVGFFDAKGPCAGGELSIADCAMAPFAYLIDTLAPAFDCPSPVSRVPRFARWWAELSGLPEVAAANAIMSKGVAAMRPAQPA